SLTYTVPNYDGSYYLKAYVDRYADEINTTNDTLVSQFSCRRNATGIADHVAAGWSVGQNEPNPASGVTVIPFVIPEDAEVALTIMGVNGQLLHREIVAATAGANRVTLHTGTLPSGLYYYGVEYKGQRIVRKMNVVR
ncbi:MAG: T9SS type A sorting domain-containing protein, partial [Bacteroidales bacterium]|nr:T9SS type A sorting domain-containing protein [Bacteroidales bacterium]